MNFELSVSSSIGKSETTLSSPKTIVQLTQQKYTLTLVYVAFAGFPEVKVKFLLVPMRLRISRKEN